MKNLFKKVFYVAIFVLSGIVFQISCSNSDDSATNVQTNKLVFYRANGSGSGFWICDYDGSNQTAIPVVLPSTILITTTTVAPHLSPDGQKLFFEGIVSSNNTQNIYSCNIDGSNLQEIVTSSTSGGGIIALGNAN